LNSRDDGKNGNETEDEVGNDIGILFSWIGVCYSGLWLKEVDRLLMMLIIRK
jgi:hypothetical protein